MELLKIWNESINCFLETSIKSAKLTCMKLSKFNGINPPPVIIGGFKHFCNTSTYNDCTFNGPLYHWDSYLHVKHYCKFKLIILKRVLKSSVSVIQYINIYQSYILWKISSLELTTNCPIIITKSRWINWATVKPHNVKNRVPISVSAN